MVDGGSTDGTLKILRDEPDIRVIEAKCHGRGEAVHIGLAHARGEYVVAFHGDGEYDVASIAEVVFELRKDSDSVVLASRTLGDRVPATGCVPCTAATAFCTRSATGAVSWSRSC